MDAVHPSYVNYKSSFSPWFSPYFFVSYDVSLIIYLIDFLLFPSSTSSCLLLNQIIDFFLLLLFFFPRVPFQFYLFNISNGQKIYLIIYKKNLPGTVPVPTMSKTENIIKFSNQSFTTIQPFVQWKKKYTHTHTHLPPHFVDNVDQIKHSNQQENKK